LVNEKRWGKVGLRRRGGKNLKSVSKKGRKE